MSVWTSSQNKALGWFYFVVAGVGLAAALLTQPLDEWGGWGVVMAIAVAAMALIGIYQGITGKGNTRSRAMSERQQRRFSIFGLVFLTLAVGTLILGDAGQWTAVDTLSLTIWIAIGGMFISQIITLGKDD